MIDRASVGGGGEGRSSLACEKSATVNHESKFIFDR